MPDTAPLEKIDIPVETEFDLTDDQKRRIGAMVLGNNFADHRGGFVASEDGKSRQLARIHFTSDAGKALEGSETTIDGVDSFRAPGPVHVVLEDAEGGMTGMNAARGAIGASWHFGVLFAVDDEIWFCGRDTPDGELTSSDAPILKRVAGDFSERPGTEVMDLREHLPAEGEVWLSHEDEPHVVSIPWWSGYAAPAEPGDTWPGRTESRQAEQASLERMIARVRDLEADAAPAP